MKRRVHVLAVALVFLFIPAAFPAAVDYYLKIDGIDGESKDAAHRGWIELQSLQFGNSATPQFRGGCSLKSFTFVQKMDKSTPKLMEAAAKGTVFSSMILELRGERHQLGNVVLSSSQMMGAELVLRVQGQFESCATHAAAPAAASIKNIEHKLPAVQQKVQPIADNATFQFEGAAAADKFGLLKLKFMSPNHAMIVAQKGSRGHQILIGLMQARKKGKATIKTQQPYMEIKFTDLLVSSYQGGGSSGDRPTESLSLNFTKVEGTYADFQDIHYKEQ